MEVLMNILTETLTEDLSEMTMSGRRGAGDVKKIHIRPVLMKDGLMFQAASYTENKVYHRNLRAQDMIPWLAEEMKEHYRQLQIRTKDRMITVLCSKKGKVTVRQKQTAPVCLAPMAHNRQKQYILPEGIPIPFLVDLGVMSPEGKIIRKKYDKYRQINRFLEFIQDILPDLKKMAGNRPMTIIDFGCGKSYLTFAMYYYLHIMNHCQVRMIGLDLKEDVIRHCNELRDRYGYDHLEFLQGDIADYEGVSRVDMVVTLHACDTATDHALYKAICWNAGVILSVPCCQHELNGQMACDTLEPVLKYGLIKERMAALVTDGLRGRLLEAAGYKTQLLEFIDMEHTPKNILIRATRQVAQARPALEDGTDMADYDACCRMLHVQGTLDRLMRPGYRS